MSLKLFSYSPLLALSMTALALGGCVSTNDEAWRTVSVVPAGLAQSCMLKGNVYSEAPYFGVFTGTTEEKLVKLAKESALRLGGNALVLGQPVEKGNKYTLEGQAYHCVK